MRNIYIDTFELEDLLNHLKPAELKVYNYIMGLVIKNPNTSDFDTPHIAAGTHLSEGTVKKARATLVKQGYLIIRKFKDESNDTMVRVAIGKDQVALYNAGLKVEIRDASKYRELERKFDFLNPTLTHDERKERAQAANQYYLDTYA